MASPHDLYPIGFTPSKPYPHYHPVNWPIDEEELFVMEEYNTRNRDNDFFHLITESIRAEDAWSAGLPTIRAYLTYLHLKLHNETMLHSYHNVGFMKSVAKNVGILDGIAPEKIDGHLKTSSELMILGLYDGILFLDKLKPVDHATVPLVEAQKHNTSHHKLGVWSTGRCVRSEMTELTFNQLCKCNTQYGWTQFGMELNLLMKVPLRHKENGNECASVSTYSIEKKSEELRFCIPMEVDQNCRAVKFLREITSVSMLQSLLQKTAQMTVDVPHGDMAPVGDDLAGVDRVLLVRDAKLTGFLRLKSWEAMV